MTSRRLAAILSFAGLLLSATACVTSGPEQDIQPGERPALDTDEAGFWMVMDQVEKKLRTSSRVENDPALNAYVHSIACNLAGPYCKDIRIYVVRHAGFNASMAPNGSMHVWTGLLLRAENEAQLAHIMGHEMAHYLRRHTLTRWRDMRAKTDAAVFIGLAGALAGVPFAGTLTQLVALGSIASFSREQEREADRIGFEMFQEAGYDPQQAPRIWEALIEEKEAGDWPAPPLFFSSHPPSEERAKTLEMLAEELQTDAVPITSEERHLAATLPLRPVWLRDELRQRNFGSMELLLGRLIEAGHGLGQLYYFQGEFHRLRGEDEDDESAAEAYRQAIEAGDAPPETYRSLGLVYWSQDKADAARAALETYLSAVPDAQDRLMIESYVEELERGPES